MRRGDAKWAARGSPGLSPWPHTAPHTLAHTARPPTLQPVQVLAHLAALLRGRRAGRENNRHLGGLGGLQVGRLWQPLGASASGTPAISYPSALARVTEPQPTSGCLGSSPAWYTLMHRVKWPRSWSRVTAEWGQAQGRALTRVHEGSGKGVGQGRAVASLQQQPAGS